MIYENSIDYNLLMIWSKKSKIFIEHAIPLYDIDHMQLGYYDYPYSYYVRYQKTFYKYKDKETLLMMLISYCHMEER